MWQRNLDDRGWQVKRNLTSTEYGDYWKARRAEGYRRGRAPRPTWSTGTGTGPASGWTTSRSYAWASQPRPDRGRVRRRHGRSTRGRDDAGRHRRVRHRRRPTRTPAVWVTSSVRRLAARPRPHEAGVGRHVRRQRGRRLSACCHFESVLVGGKQRYSGVYVTNDNGRGWFFRRDMTKKELHQLVVPLPRPRLPRGRPGPLPDRPTARGTPRSGGRTTSGPAGPCARDVDDADRRTSWTSPTSRSPGIAVAVYRRRRAGVPARLRRRRRRGRHLDGLRAHRLDRVGQPRPSPGC